MARLENRTINEIRVGDTASFTKTLTKRDTQLFALTSGDINPVHLDEAFAANTPFGECIGHGMWSGALVSAAIATQLPGPGSIYRSQSLKFIKPVKIGDSLTVCLEVTAIRERAALVTLACIVKNQYDETVAKGEAEVIAPAEKTVIDAPEPVLD